MIHAQPSLKTKLALFITILLWASAFPGIRAGLTGYSPGALALLRFIVASICLYIIYRRVPLRRYPIQLKDALLLLLSGAITIGGYHIGLNYGEITTPSGQASFIISQGSIVTVICGVIFLKEKINKTIITGILISIIGIGLLTLNNQKFNFSIGFFYVLLAAILGGVYPILQKPFIKKYHVIDVTAYIMWGATLLLLFFAPDLYQEIKVASRYATLSVIYLGMFPAAIAYVLWNYVLNEIPATRASVYLYFLPIFATFLGWLWLGEVPSLFSIVGGIVALAGVCLVNHAYRNLK